jgi:hypothetical protein
LVAVQGDPLHDIKILESVNLIKKNGKVVKSEVAKASKVVQKTE